MTNLIKLPEGKVSLEFSQKDLPTLTKIIQTHFGDITETKAIVSSELNFGGSHFTFYHEWDDLCLISTNAHGTTILNELFLLLNDNI